MCAAALLVRRRFRRLGFCEHAQRKDGSLSGEMEISFRSDDLVEPV